MLWKRLTNCRFTGYIHSHMLIHCSNAFLFMSQVHMRVFSPNRPCQHNTRPVYLDVHGYDAEGTIMKGYRREDVSMYTWWVIPASDEERLTGYSQGV